MVVVGPAAVGALTGLPYPPLVAEPVLSTTR